MLFLGWISGKITKLNLIPGGAPPPQTPPKSRPPASPNIRFSYEKLDLETENPIFGEAGGRLIGGSGGAELPQESSYVLCQRRASIRGAPSKCSGTRRSTTSSGGGA